MVKTRLQIWRRRHSLGGSLALLVTAMALQQQLHPTAADTTTPTVVHKAGKIAVDPTASETDDELNPTGQLNTATTAPSGPAMLNGQKVTSANLNKLAQQSTTPFVTGTLAGTTNSAAASTATTTPAAAVKTPAAAASTQRLVSSAVSQQQPQSGFVGTLGGSVTAASGGGQSAASRFVQQAPAAVAATPAVRSAGVVSGGSAGGSREGQRVGTVTAVYGGRRLMLGTLRAPL